MQIYQSILGANIVNQALGGIIGHSLHNTLGTSRQIYRGTTTGTTISQSATDSQTSILIVTEIDSSKTIAIYPNSQSGANNPVVLLGDNQIICYGGASNTQSLVVGVSSNQSNGIKIIFFRP